jgi:uncharacterized protein (TIGR03437 family)
MTYVRKIQVYKAIISFSIAVSCALSASAQTAPTYTITTVAGNGTAGFGGDGGSPTAAQLFLPFAAAVAGGNIYITDQVNHRVRIVNSSSINTLTGTGTAGFSGNDAAASKAQIFNPAGIIADNSGNVFFSDTRNQVVRKINSSGTITAYAGDANQGAGFSGDTGSAKNSRLNTPAGLALDSGGNLYIADAANNKIRKVTTGDVITSFAGNITPDFAGDGGPAINAELNNPEGVAVDAIGNVYIADTFNHRIRLVTLDGNIRTVAGNGKPGFAGDGGQATNAQLNHPEGVAVDAAGNIYIADSFNQRVRMVLTNGKIVTIAGNGGQAYTGDGDVATKATLNFPTSVFVDPQGNVYVSDSQNYVVRMLTPSAAPVSPGVPSIKAGGIITASGFGGFPTVAQGSWVEIYGSNLAADTRLWAASDFNGINAPTSLNRTTVSIGGQAAYVEFVSQNQVNALLPSAIQTGQQSVVVSNSVGNSSGFNINVVATQPGLFAPPQLAVSGKQYVGALALDGKTYIGPPAAFTGITSARAKVGDIITLYGVGFGGVNPVIPSGQIVQTVNSLTTPIEIKIGGAVASTSCGQCYAGLSPGSIGLFQFNVQVPSIPPSDAAPVTFTLGGVPGSQTLFTAVQ